LIGEIIKDGGCMMNSITTLLCQVLIIMFMATDICAALIPPFFLDCVVAIGSRKSDSTINWEGTGFLIGKFVKEGENKQKLYRVYLVTNKHVFQNKKAMVVRFNPQSNEPAQDFDTPLINQVGNIIWTGHPNDNVDVAVIPINVNLLKEQKMRYNYFMSDDHILTAAQMSEKGITEGDFIYVLGFPMGIVDPERQYVIARSGSIARIKDVLDKHRIEFIIDAFVFPGNSGGPVVSKPEAFGIEGTKTVGNAYLIGIVKEYITYSDVAVSLQTKKPRIVFEENSGLTAVIPTDYILEAIETAEKKAD
jgi:S1-C subfamily serine protease